VVFLVAEEVSKLGYGDVSREAVSDWLEAGRKANFSKITKPKDLKLYTIWIFFIQRLLKHVALVYS
jgi:hypothetical protein